jgi:hypothetical protein
LCPEPALEVAAHPAVEATLFHQPDRSRYVLNLVNFQPTLPNLPVDDIAVRLRLPRRVRRVRVIPSGDSLRFRSRPGVTAFRVPRLHTLLMIELACG